MKTTYIWCLLAVAVMAFSCQKMETEPSPQQATPQDQDPFANAPRQENPYTVATMQRALQQLQSKNGNAYPEAKIQATHYYIKFTPKDEREYDILKTDSLLDLYKYPLDVEDWVIKDILRSLPERNTPPVFWAAVKVNHPLPQGCPYEILERLYIPHEDKTEDDGKHSTQSLAFADALEDEAFRLTGHLDPQTETAKAARRWRPAGTIKVWDDNFSQFLGLEGVVVRARNWFITHKGTTRANGYFRANGLFRKRRKANYSIDWERYDFAIQDGWLSGATYNGPKKKGDWNLNIWTHKQEYYATIFRAAHHYYYKNIKGLRRPPQNSFWKTQLKIRANYEQKDKNGLHKPGKRFLGAQIQIYNPQHESMRIYASVIHEITHASHWNMDRNTYKDTEAVVYESWARGVQWELTRMVYPDYSEENQLSRLRYTGIVEDLIDGTKTRISEYYWSKTVSFNRLVKSYNDQVSGYTIRQLEDALYGKKTLDDWKENIKARYANRTENFLDTTFDFWNTK